MRDALLKGIQHFCWLFPPLRANIQYSEILSQEDVDVFSAFVNGHVQKALHSADDELVIEHFLTGSTGVSKIHSNDVVFVETLLAAASGSDTILTHELRDCVDFLRSHKAVWWSLHRAYEKIVKNHLVGTCPLVIAKPPLIDRILPFGRRVHRFQEFHKLFHESIHYVLEDNGLFFGDENLDEGLVTYFHEQVMGKPVCYMHYNNEEGERYLEAAKLFEKLLGRYPRSAVVPLLKSMKREDVPRAQ
jgi:hypothetical protein